MTVTQLPILNPQDITKSWLNEVLRGAGHDVTVENFVSKRVGTGQVGETYRFTLELDGKNPSAPTTIVGKFPSSDPESRATGVNLGNYLREVRFYQKLAPSALITTPVCLHADVDEETSDFVLMMEDLSPAEQGDQLKGLTLEQAELGIIEAAKLHASHWGDESLDVYPWLTGTSSAPEGLSDEMMGELWKGFCSRYSDLVKPEEVEIGEALIRNYEFYRTGYEGPRCLTHADFRPDNMMFGTAEGGYPLAVVDWQSVGLGAAMADVSYFLSGALTRETLRGHEDQLLKRYHQTLIEHGVKDFTLDNVWNGYRHFSFSLFIMAFAASMIVERTERGDAMFFAMLRGGSGHVTDLEALDLL